jgi:uncharacterized membrane protein
MQWLYQFLKTNVLGGLVVLVPVAVSVNIISALVKKFLSVFAPIAKELHVESVGAVRMVKAELVEKLDVSMHKVVDCITQLGIGSSTLTSMTQAPASPTENDR